MKSKALFASLAIASVAVSQPAGAATRSYQSLPERGVQSSQVAERVGSNAAEAEELRGGRPLVTIVVVFAVLAALILALGGGGNSSPG